jgi:hypothetical protein
MTLSRFLRDYLYFSLGGNRHGSVRRYRNLFITMLLGGLWHGASWTFVIWGGLHGTFLAINHLWRRTGLQLPGPMAWVITFGAVMIGWVFRCSVARASTSHPDRDGWVEQPRLVGATVLDRRQPSPTDPTRTGRRVVVSESAGDHGWRWRSDWYALAFAVWRE